MNVITRNFYSNFSFIIKHNGIHILLEIPNLNRLIVQSFIKKYCIFYSYDQWILIIITIHRWVRLKIYKTQINEIRYHIYDSVLFVSNLINLVKIS